MCFRRINFFIVPLSNHRRTILIKNNTWHACSGMFTVKINNLIPYIVLTNTFIYLIESILGIVHYYGPIENYDFIRI